MASRRASTPADWDPNLTRTRLRQLTTKVRTTYDRAHSRCKRGTDGLPSASFNRIDATLRRLQHLETEVTWLKVEGKWNAYTVWLGPDERGRTPLRIWIFDKPCPPVLANEAAYLAGKRQLDLFSVLMPDRPLDADDTILRLVVEHNMAPASERRAVSVWLKLLSRDGSACYQTWHLWSAKAKVLPTRQLAIAAGPSVPHLVPADPIAAVTVELLDDKQNEGT